MALWASHQKMTPRGLCGEGQVQAQARGWRWGSPPLPSGTLDSSAQATKWQVARSSPRTAQSLADQSQPLWAR